MFKSNPIGKLIVFEGPDGVGKTTIARGVADALTARGYPCELLSFPGRDSGTLGGLVYEIHHDSLSHAVRNVAPAAMQALHLAAHLDAIERLLLPTLKTERHVLLDRFWWSTWVYGIVGGAKRSVLHHMIAAELAQWGSVVPTAAVVLRRPSPLDREHDLGHWLALREAYDELAHSQRKRHPVLIVENLNTLNEVRDDIVEQLMPLLRSGSPKRRKNPLQHLAISYH